MRSSTSVTRPARCLLRLVSDAGWHRARHEINGTEREIDAADDPVALFRFHAEIVGQNAFGDYPGVVSVKGELSDPLADKVLRLFDAAVSIDVDGAVPERADREDGNRQERRATLLIEGAQEVGHA
jgi:hypothetical protein